MQFGELTRERVLLHVFSQKAAMAKLRPKDPEWWLQEIARYLTPYEELAPHFVEEMQGLAKGAGVTFEEVLLLNVRDELLMSLRPQPSEGCTSFGCSGDVTLSGQPILGQTKDTAAISKDLYVVIAVSQEGRPDLLQMPYAGEFGVFGLSSSGMAIFGNALYVKGRPTGYLPLSLFRRLVLEADSLGEVIDLVETHGIATVGSLTIGDRHGRIVAIENTDHGHAVVKAQNGILAHANHVNDAVLANFEVYEEDERNVSHHRQNRLVQQFEPERGRLTTAFAMRCLMDHDGYPDSICRHPKPGRDLQTTAAVVVEPTLGRLHAVRGLPCQSWPVTYTL
jgi:isopenicillin-N N-acyltransferase-like protein